MKKDYTKFSEPSKETENNIVTEENKVADEFKVTDEFTVMEEGNAEIYVEPVVDDETIDTPAEEVENTDESTDLEEHTGDTLIPEIVEGTLKSCTKLNMRKEPSKESEIVCVIGETVEFTVDLTHSTDDFYKVYTNDHDGYCMKQFINID